MFGDAQNLASNREDWLRWLRDTSRDTRNDHEDRNGQQGGEDRGKSVLGTTVLWHPNHLLDDPADQVHPAHRSGEGEARDDRIERLGFQFLGNKVNSLESLSGHARHGKSFILYTRKIFIRGVVLPLLQFFYTLVS